MRINQLQYVSLAFLAAGTVFGQAAAPLDAEALMLPKIERIRNAKAAAQKLRAAGNTALAETADDAVRQEAGELTPFLQPYLEDRLKQQGYRFALSQIEESRWNKQTGTGTAAAGSTSVVSKGSVPALFGFAVENGALTRSISGTAVTFRGSPVNIYSALAKGGYIPAGPAVPQLDGSFESIAKRVSFHVSFDTSRGNAANAGNVLTGDKQQLAGWGTRVELVNKRDPRRSEYKAAWDDLMNTKGLSYINDITGLEGTLRRHPAVLEWRTKLADDALKAAGGFSSAASNFGETIIGEAVMDACDKLAVDVAARAAGAASSAKAVEIEALVADSSGTSMTINAGSAAGVQNGQKLTVYHKGKEIKDPKTGEVLDVDVSPIGTLTITTVRERIATGTYAGSPAVNGDIVRNQ